MPRLRETETDEKLNHRKRICSQVRRVDQTPYQPWHSPLHWATSYAHVAPLHIDKVEVLHLFRCYTHTADRVRDLLYLLWLKTFWCWGCQNGMKTVSWDKPWPTTALKSQRSQQFKQCGSKCKWFITQYIHRNAIASLVSICKSARLPLPTFVWRWAESF